MHRYAVVTVAIATFATCLGVAEPAHAQRNAFGIRGGVAVDPDMVFFGGHGAIRLRAAPRLRLEPSLELGIGDDADFFGLMFNFNFKYLIPLGHGKAFYPLFGPALFYFNRNNCEGDGCDDFDVGVNLGAGFELSPFMFDIVLGVGDIPDFRFTLGYTF